MASIKHKFVSGIADDPLSQAAGEVIPSHWNDEHSVSLVAADISALGFITSASVSTQFASLSLDALLHVSLSQSVANGQALIWNEAQGQWVNGAPSANVGSGTHTAGAFYVRGSATFSGTAVFLTAVTFNGTVSFSATVFFTNISATNFGATGSASFASTVNMASTLGVSATASVGALVIGGHAFNLSLSQSVATGQVLTYNNVDNKWRNVTPASGTTLATLTDVSLSQSVATGQVLTYDNAQNKWINQTPAAGSGSGTETVAAFIVLGSATFSGTAVFLTDIRVAGDLHVSSTASVGALNIAGTSFVPGDYLTSNSFSAAIAAYATSASVSTMIAAQISAGGFLTSASASSSLLTTALTVLGSATFSGTAVFGKSIEVSLTASVGHLNVGGTTALTGQLTVAGTATFSGTAVFLTGAAISGTLSTGGLVVAAGATFNGSATFSGTVVFLTDVRIAADLHVSQTASVGALNIAGTAFVPADYLTSNSFSAAIAGYVTSNSLSAALATYLSSNSFSAAIAAYATSNSVSVMITSRISTLDNIGDVSLSHSVSDGQFLTWNNTANQWVNTTVTPGSVSATLTVDTFTVAGSATFQGHTLFKATVSFSATVAFANITATNFGVTGSASFAGQATFAGTATFSGTAVFLTGAAISGTLSTGGIVVAAGATFNGSATFSGTAVFLTVAAPAVANIGSASISANLVVSGQLTVAGSATFSGTAVFLTVAAPVVANIGSASISANLVVSGQLTVAGTATFSGTVAMSTALRVSGTASVGVFKIAGFPAGSVLLGSASIAANSIRFSGSWSDYGILEVRCFFKATASGSVHIDIYTDGGTTAILRLDPAGSATASHMFVTADIYNGTAFKGIHARKIMNAIVNEAGSVTANTGFINALMVSVGTSLTLSSGMAQLYGRRR